MKRKLKNRYIKRLNTLLAYCNGWPLNLILADRHPRYNDEWRHYKKWDSYARTKAGRLDGSYEFLFNKKPSRISLGN